MNRQKKCHSNIFKGFQFHIGIHRDFQHQKIWGQKVQETKHIQQRKQIDKIFQGIVKQRIFGNIISEKSRLSKQEYSILDKINRTATNSFFRNTRTSKMNRTNPNSPSKSFDTASYQTPLHNLKQAKKIGLQPLNFNKLQAAQNIRKKVLTIDNSTIYGQFMRSNTRDVSGQKSPKFSVNSGKVTRQRFLSFQRNKTDSKSITSKYLKKLQNQRQQFDCPKQLSLDNLDTFENHFKALSLSPNLYLDDIKLSKETLIMKIKNSINPRLIEHQYDVQTVQKGIEKAFNSSVDLIYFFTFRVLDESGNGFLTISDLFRFLQRYSDTNYFQTEIYKLKQKINSISKKLVAVSNDQKRVKPSLQQILVVNQKLKADEVSQLLKQSVKQQINRGGQFKLTCYSQSILSLQHDVNVRLKQYQLQNKKNESQALNANKNSNDQKQNETLNQDGIRLKQFSQIFNGRRPKIFCMILNVLTGLKNEDYE